MVLWSDTTQSYARSHIPFSVAPCTFVLPSMSSPAARMRAKKARVQSLLRSSMTPALMPK